MKAPAVAQTEVKGRLRRKGFNKLEAVAYFDVSMYEHKVIFLHDGCIRGT